MKPRIAIASVFAAALIGAGILAGSVMGTSGASAQTSTATPKATPTASSGDTQQTTPANPPAGAPGAFGGRGGPMGRGGMGMGPGGHGDFGGPFGQGATADSTTHAISETTNFITLVKSDLAYANGKMDTTDVQKWVDGADSLLASAQSADSNSKYEQAVAYARAAQQLAMVADHQMAQKLGADKLPSYSQRPQRPQHDNAPSTITTPTQAQASRIVAQTYERLVEQAAVIKAASNPGDATTYLADAQNAYKAAYDAYQAGNYSDAVAAARTAEQLSNVAEQVLDAATAPASSDTPVTVPAPNF